MRVTLNQAELHSAFEAVAPMFGRPAALRALECMLLQARDDTLTITATNLEAAATITLPCSVERPGRILLPCRRLRHIVKRLGSRRITIDDETAGSIHLSAEGFNLSMPALDPDEFPTVFFRATKYDRFVTLPAGDLLRLLETALMTACTDESCPSLNAVLLSFDGLLTLTSSDSFRLSRQFVFLPQADRSGSGELLLPQNALNGIVRALRQWTRSTDEIDLLYITSPAGTWRGVEFQADGLFLRCGLRDGRFPDYGHIVNPVIDRQTSRVTLDKGDLLRSIVLAEMIARENAGITQLEGGEGSLTVRARSSFGEVSTVVKACIAGKPCKTALNFKYLRDAVQRTVGEKVVLDFQTATSPVVVRSEDLDSYYCIIMPMQAGER